MELSVQHKRRWLVYLLRFGVGALALLGLLAAYAEDRTSDAPDTTPAESAILAWLLLF